MILLFFSGAAAAICAGGIHKLTGVQASDTAAPLKNKRNGVGSLATIDMALLTELWASARCGRCGCFQATEHTSGRALGGLNNHEKDVGNDKDPPFGPTHGSHLFGGRHRTLLLKEARGNHLPLFRRAGSW